MNAECDQSSIVQQSPLVCRSAHKEKKPYKCPECNKCFRRRWNLVIHERSHTGVRPYKCAECSKGFITAGNLKNHLSIHSEEKPYKCPECNKCFRRRWNLVIHERTHKRERPYKCSECSKSFTTTASLRIHLSLHSGERPYKCCECSKCFIQRSALVQHERVHESEKPYKCAECSKGFITASNLRNHLTIHSGEKLYKCPECSKCFRRRGDLVIHERIHMDKGEKPYKCAECSKGFTTAGNLRTHLSLHSREKPYKCPECSKCFRLRGGLVIHERIHMGKREKPYKCAECSKGFTTAGSLRTHLSVHSGEKPYKCPECSKCFRLRGDLVKHERTHMLEKPYKCPECNRGFKTTRALRLHLPVHSGVRPYKCCKCKKSFVQRSSLLHHERTHMGERPYKCPECKKCFRQRWDLVIHERTHMRERPYKCPECSKGFTTARNLRNHLLAHSGEKPYKCPECSKGFTTARNLRNHLLIHSGEKPYKCPECSKGFTTARTLRNHLSLHSGEKPYKCPECNKGFTTAGNLRNHLSVHSGEKPYKCPECSKGFTAARNLRNHLSLHSGEKPYKCPECNKGFTTAGNLRNHHSVHSGEKPYKCPESSKCFRHSSTLVKHESTHTDEKSASKGEYLRTKAENKSVLRYFLGVISADVCLSGFSWFWFWYFGLFIGFVCTMAEAAEDPLLNLSIYPTPSAETTSLSTLLISALTDIKGSLQILISKANAKESSMKASSPVGSFQELDTVICLDNPPMVVKNVTAVKNPGMNEQRIIGRATLSHFFDRADNPFGTFGRQEGTTKKTPWHRDFSEKREQFSKLLQRYNSIHLENYYFLRCLELQMVPKGLRFFKCPNGVQSSDPFFKILTGFFNEAGLSFLKLLVDNNEKKLELLKDEIVILESFFKEQFDENGFTEFFNNILQDLEQSSNDNINRKHNKLLRDIQAYETDSVFSNFGPFNKINRAYNVSRQTGVQINATAARKAQVGNNNKWSGHTVKSSSVLNFTPEPGSLTGDRHIQGNKIPGNCGGSVSLGKEAGPILETDSNNCVSVTDSNVGTKSKNVSNQSTVSEICLQDIGLLLKNMHKIDHNLTHSEFTALKKLKAMSNKVRFMKSDKGNNIVIMTKDSYTEGVLKLLNNTDEYEIISLFEIHKRQRSIYSYLYEALMEGDISCELYEFCVIDQPRIGVFFGIPKSHKSFVNPPFRPIVSSPHSITEGLALVIDALLGPTIIHEMSFLRDSWHFLTKLNSFLSTFSFDPKQHSMLTVDVVSLYTCIPQDLGIEAVQNFLTNYYSGFSQRTISLICRFLEIILENNFFLFEQTYYRQRRGAAMGSSAAPAYANVVMAMWERQFMPFLVDKYHILFHCRFIDDLFFIIDESDVCIDLFLTDINSFSTYIKFVIGGKGITVDFLDVNLRWDDEDKRIHSTIHRKKTFNNGYLHYKSGHPTHVISNIPKGQFIRASRMTSKESDVLQEFGFIISLFLNRGFPKLDLMYIANDIYNRRTSHFLPLLSLSMEKTNIMVINSGNSSTSSMVCTLGMNSDSKHIKNIITKNWRIIKGNADMYGVLGEKPLFVQRNDNNLKKILEQHNGNKLSVNTTKKGMYRCHDCNMCRYISVGPYISVLTSERILSVPGYVNCRTSGHTENIISSLELKVRDLKDLQTKTETEFLLTEKNILQKSLQNCTSFFMKRSKNSFKQLSKASEILKEMEEKFECIKTGVTEIHSAVSDINFGFKKEVDILEERNDTDNLATTEELVLGDTSERGKHKTNGVLSAPESFEDVAVTFSAEEMKMLTKQDKELHKEVMLENYETLVSAGNGSREWSICQSQQPSLGASLLCYPTENLQHSVQTLKGSDRHPVIPVAQLHPGFTCNMNAECDQSSVVQQSPLVGRSAHKEKKPYKCPECNKCFKHKSHLVIHERIHTGVRPYKCVECSKCFRQRANLVIHERTHRKERPYICAEFKKCFIQRTALEQHERTHIGEGEKTYKCAECSKGFTTARNLSNHLSIHSGEKPYKCPECSKCFRQKGDLVIHERIHMLEKPYKCPECNKGFTTAGNLRTHLSVHSGEKPYKCSECSKGFTTAGNLRTHLSVHSGEKPYKCSECSKCFRLRRNIVIHERIHLGKVENPYKCVECSKGFTSAGSLRTHLSVHSGEKPYKCPECSKCFRQRGDLVKHERIHMLEKPYKCPECNKGFTTAGNLRTHLSVHSGEKPYKCPECSKCFRLRGPLVIHERIHMGKGEKPYKCVECSKGFTTAGNLRTHLSVHSGEKPYKCPECSKCFRLRGDLVIHERIHMGKGEKPYKCVECGKGFTTAGSLRTHLSVHSGEKPYKCPECSKCFRLRRDLVIHERIHMREGEKPYKCVECNKGFTTAGSLRTHLSVHSGEKPYKCPECSKRFRLRTDLVIHERIHMGKGEKPYKCVECNKGFTTAGSLRTHLSVHSGEKPYKCPECSKCFRQRGDLVKHERIHMLEKPYKCPECNKGFTTTGNLRNHLSVHSGEKPYKCPECSKCFRQSSTLVKHERTHTDENSASEGE
ncbi:LOW QUALITY PROTEIN: uncharacterized protein LOC122814417 [Protopterus annectens]|uniref:LOW QUALITY PROTEIN: uncharacterized protein LOC122814417 n=1 Tax=Protopterus annectens TaxID=7888 RepID=UPI001CFB0021|nr:LOW QUALITY PROTEIN: uncharacterized protein LOC122814417 [Protopterus annectens]